MSARNSLAFAGLWDEAALAVAKSRLRSHETTPVIKDSVHLQPCSFRDMNPIALSARSTSAVNSSTFAHRSRATASSLAHNMRLWPMFSLGPPQKIQGCAAIAVS